MRFLKDNTKTDIIAASVTVAVYLAVVIYFAACAYH